jgi:predicted SAM-dependent methyltransferase
LTLSESREAAALCFEFLKPSGYLRCAVPDGNFPDDAYQAIARGDVPPDHPAADHKTVYNYMTFSEVFRDAGFDVDLLEYCDENGRFHYNHWDATKGIIYRSLRFDHRNKDGQLGNISLIIDAIKPK